MFRIPWLSRGFRTSRHMSRPRWTKFPIGSQVKFGAYTWTWRAQP